MKLHDYLDYHARETPGAEFSVFRGQSLSYGEARRRVDQLARALLAEGLEPGDRVAVLAKNCTEYPLLYFACSKLGIVPVPLNYRLAPPEWSYIIRDAGAAMLVARGELVAAADALRPELDRIKRFLAIEAPAPAGWTRFESWVEPHPSEPLDREISDDADVYQMYTSGTTGRPKGARLSHRAVTSNVFQLAGGLALQRGERYLIVAPLYHAAAALAAFVAVSAGGSLYLQEDFIPAEVARALDEEEIVMTTLVPAMIQACLVMVPGVRDRRYAGLKQITYGASPIAEDTLRSAIEVFGCDFVQGYGMTETTAVITILSAEDHQRALAERPELLRSCGRPVLGTELRIADAEGRSLPPGKVGEILARGPQLMRGYWGRDDATREALEDGWMHTGDAGLLDEEGYLYIQDRMKDMIVSGGENVYPSEIENALFEHPAVADAAVIGVPDAKWGESVLAIVVRREEVGAQDLIEHCRARLAGYKIPRTVEFAEALPRNPSGKVLKKELREPYWKGHTRRVS